MRIRYMFIRHTLSTNWTVLPLDLDVAKSQRDKQQIDLFWLGGQRQQQSEDVIDALGMLVSCEDMPVHKRRLSYGVCINNDLLASHSGIC